ncbi:MAG: branched-chain amino acid ABC transporter permease [Deltaproteobacteria bacterium]|nr:branched-chain amino acid ABC transporter permease [Deltaproteobacteria bacterium]
MRYLAKYAIGIIALFAIFFLAEQFLPGFWLTLLLLFGINTILAVSLNITNGWANLFSLGHGGVMLVGGYAAAFLTLPVSFKHDLLNLALPAFISTHQIPFLPALLFGGVVGMAFGLILALPALRLKGLYFILATLGFNYITITIAENIPEVTNGPMGLRQFPADTNIWWVWGIAISLIYIALRLRNSYFGRALIAMGQDQDMAEHMGVNLLKYKAYAFGFSSFFTAIGGVLWVHLILNLYPRVFGLHLVFNVVTMIVIGGLGSITGAIIGAALITGFTEILSPLEEGFHFLGVVHVPRMLGLTTLMLAALLIIILVLRPEGIMGNRELSLGRIKRALHRCLPNQSG